MPAEQLARELSAEVVSLGEIAPGVYRLRLRGGFPAHRPGQFLNLSVPGFYLRRPLSVCDQRGDTVTLVFKAVGEGTRVLSMLRPGDRVSLLCGLGNGFDLSDPGQLPLVVGGGLGIPPLYFLCRELLDMGLIPAVVLGFNSQEEIFLDEDFRALGLNPMLCTADGSFGRSGLVTGHLPGSFDRVYACGPIPMMRALADRVRVPYQFSYEERMACGFGACMGCVIPTKQGPMRVCHDGPVFNQEVV